MLLIALIAIAWLTVTALCVAVCMAARRGDAGDGAEVSPSASRSRAHAGRRQSGRAATGEGLIVWDGLPELSVQAREARLTAHSAR